MIAGKMNERISVYAPAVTETGFGSETTQWELVGVWHTERVRLTGRRVQEAAEMYTDYRVDLRISWGHRPKEGWQIDYEGNRYVICSIDPQRRRGMRVLSCERVNP